MRVPYWVLVTGVFVVALLVPCLAVVGFTMSHEEAHREVFSLYGVDSVIHYNFVGVSETIPSPVNVSEAEGLSIAQSQSLVEAFGYQLLPVVVLLGAVASLLFMLLASGFLRGDSP